MEKWEWINGYEGLYQISNLGRVKSFKRKNIKILKGTLSNHGYPRVALNGKYQLVHRLVAEAFVPNPHNYNIVDHLDNDRANPRFDNLEWVTHGENLRRGYQRSWEKTIEEYL